MKFIFGDCKQSINQRGAINEVKIRKLPGNTDTPVKKAICHSASFIIIHKNPGWFSYHLVSRRDKELLKVVDIVKDP